MKKIYLIVIILLCKLAVVYSQSATGYDTCSAIKQFEGNWMSINGTDTIRISLKYARVYYADYNCVYDRLYGWHEYKKGTVVVESNYQNRNTPILYNDTLTSKSFSISLTLDKSGCDFTNLKGIGTVMDYIRNSDHHLLKVELNASKTEITWRQDYRSGFGLITGAAGMTLPKQFVLLKQP